MNLAWQSYQVDEDIVADYNEPIFGMETKHNVLISRLLPSMTLGYKIYPARGIKAQLQFEKTAWVLRMMKTILCPLPALKATLFPAGAFNTGSLLSANTVSPASNPPISIITDWDMGKIIFVDMNYMSLTDWMWRLGNTNSLTNY
jgi:hypothetical protein